MACRFEFDDVSADVPISQKHPKSSQLYGRFLPVLVGCLDFREQNLILTL